MNDELIMITPEVEAGAGGVADYTLRLVTEWGDAIRVRYLTPRDGDILAKLPAAGGKVLLQYSAYGFQRRGFPRRLLRGLREWKTRTGGLLVIMFHEIWSFRSAFSVDYFVQHFHRAEIGQLLRVADAVFTSTPDQVEHLRRLAPESNIQLL
ncbi:MAG: glycosyltransferase, partial [Verrucomicrobiota bacterium]|nr:glycosyltransferase [Verrucomicrobiota bacterium]